MRKVRKGQDILLNWVKLEFDSCGLNAASTGVNSDEWLAYVAETTPKTCPPEISPSLWNSVLIEKPASVML
jgi:hypothetical protein